jgi:integrase
MLMKTTDPIARLHAQGLQLGLFPEVLDRLTEDGRDNLEAYLSNSADSTIATFRFDTLRWVAWAETNDVDPLGPRARQVRDYAKEVEPGLKPASVKRMISNVGTLTATIAGNTSHTSSMLVRAEMKRQRRQKGSGHKQALAIRQKGDVLKLDEHPALPFSIECMLRVLEPKRTLFAARAKLLLSLGGDTGRRGGEYRDARMRDLVPIGDGSEGGVFNIPRSKTDQDGMGMIKFASKRTMKFFAEYRAMLKERGGSILPDALLFVTVDRWDWPFSSRGVSGRPLTTGGLIKILRNVVRQTLTGLIDERPDLAEDVELIVRGVSGHSFRVGLAIDLVSAGESIAAICVEGGWETPAMPVYYTRMISARTGAAARLAARLGY